LGKQIQLHLTAGTRSALAQIPLRLSASKN
jgi:hypothetical protein